MRKSLLLLTHLLILVVVSHAYSMRKEAFQLSRPNLKSSIEVSWPCWSFVEDVSFEMKKNGVMEILIALKHSNQQLQTLEDAFWAVSTPSHEHYGKHLSHEEIAKMVGASDETIDRVRRWLTDEVGAVQVETMVHRDYLRASIPLEAIESGFDVRLAMFQLAREVRGRRDVVIRSKESTYYIPEDVAGDIELVMGLTDLPVVPTTTPRGISYNSAAPSPINVNPPIIKSLYKIDVIGGSPQSGQGVAEFEEEFFYVSDVNIFIKTWSLPPVQLNLIGVDKPNSGDADLGEASLDVEYIIGIGSNITTFVFYRAPFDLIGWGLNVSGTPNSPKVHSISYGSAEDSYDLSILDATNLEFQKLGAAGFTILISSGDDGTGHSGIISCGHFLPNFPASSPYVTSVGATQISDPTGPESAASFSGGGFSNVFTRPMYQNTLVSHYLSQSGLPDSKYYNSTGRGIPDVSAVGVNFEVIIQNFTGPISGTSASSPTFAGIIALVNDQRFQQELSPLGFINPLLYQLGSVGTDIISGNNKATFCSEGFPALAGWDAVTGLGTPQLPYLLQKLITI